MDTQYILDHLRGKGRTWKFLPFETLSSTNSFAKEIAPSFTQPTIILAETQTGGRGSKGRSFFCQKGGVYISFLFRPDSSVEDTLSYTTATAVAVCQALSPFCNKKLQIKWVNDIYAEGKKVCGILTEGGISDGKLDYAVVGIGINLIPPEGGFPPELSAIAGTLFESDNAPYDRIVVALINAFCDISFDKNCIEKYRSLHFPFPQKVTVSRFGTQEEATALSLDDKFRLQVRFSDGREEQLQSGEISLHLSK